MPDGPVITNNTPLVALWTLGRLDLLERLFTNALIPEAVYREFLALDEAERRPVIETASGIEVARLAEPRRVRAYVGLDLGEVEVLALAEERDARLVIIDERKGRRFAQRLGFRLTETLGALLLAKEVGHLTSVGSAIEALESAGMHLSKPLVEEVLSIAGE